MAVGLIDDQKEHPSASEAYETIIAELLKRVLGKIED
jgi:hypothetical protein